MHLKEVAIIGAGPGGIAAAIQLKRYGMEPLLLEKSHIGGLLVNANLVENYPGFPRGIPGADLVKLFDSQLREVGVALHFVEVRRLDWQESFILETRETKSHSRIAVVASGTKPRRFTDIEIPPEATERVFYEVYPIAGVNGKRIAIIGAGDAAFDYALNLGRRNEVTILNRGRKKRCLPLLWERAEKSPHITYREDTAIAAIRGSLNGLVLEIKSPAGKWELSADYVIFAIGRVRQLDYFSERLTKMASELEERGLLYFVGDVRNDIYRQSSIAVGDGVHVAMKIYRRSQCKF
ncbi:NAD(P)-binding domain-containing protein [Dehalococcoidia bacterium]|nr:NAD(P)-binding domain-containing protein [Dehalococcoidia bacterium]